jgi:hypothetical protein
MVIGLFPFLPALDCAGIETSGVADAGVSRLRAYRFIHSANTASRVKARSGSRRG